MLLKSLKLINFRQFKGEQSVSFSTDKERNVTVILGKNTSGKTTLIQAFNWVLYSKTNFDTKDFLLNLEVANNLRPGESAKVKVELELIHDNIDYIISREQDYYCNFDGSVKPNRAMPIVQYKLPNGQVEFINKNDITDTINKILPEDLSNYFFFDGERIGNLGKNDKIGRKDLANAVKGVLGLYVLDNAINHLSRGYKTSVIGKLKNSIDTTGDTQLESKKSELEKNKEKLENIKKIIEDYHKTIEFYSNEIDKKEKIIKENKQTSDLKKEMQKNEAEININKSNYNEAVKKYLAEFSNKSPMFFMRPLFAKAVDIVNQQKLSDKGIPEMHSVSIDFLINRGRCICGTKIEQGNEAYNNLIKLKDFLPPQYIGTLVNVFLNDIKHYNVDGEEFFDTFKGLYKNLREIKNEISELISANEEISKQIEGKIDVGKIEIEVRNLKKKLEDLREDEKNKIREETTIENNISRLEKDISILASTSEKNRFILTCIKYAEYINERLNIHYNSMEKIIREKLEKRVNSIFKKMYHGNRKIVINNNYDYKLETPDLSEEFQNMADESKGLETITSFAFISGIVDLAKEKITKDESEIKDLTEISSEPYPLIMDAPFSNADENHVENVSKILPEVAEQVIMFIMHKDWKFASNVLVSKLGKMYELNKISEIHTQIRSEDNV